MARLMGGLMMCRSWFPSPTLALLVGTIVQNVGSVEENVFSCDSSSIHDNAGNVLVVFNPFLSNILWLYLLT